jgi:hypothetical protein
MVPMKRSRADEGYLHGALGLKYCTSIPGTLAITMGMFGALHAGGYNIPTSLASGQRLL